MSRRTTIALAFALLILAAPPAAAKGPSQVEVHDLRTGGTTLLTGFPGHKMHALMELVNGPADSQRGPRGTRGGTLEHIATLSWQFDDGTLVWVDRVYSDGVGITWVHRRDHLFDPGSASWGRLEEPSAFKIVLASIEEPAADTMSSVASPAAAPIPDTDRESSPPPHSSTAFDASSFGWGAGLAGLVAAGLALAWKRHQRSVTASRNSRVSAAASS